MLNYLFGSTDQKMPVDDNNVVDITTDTQASTTKVFTASDESSRSRAWSDNSSSKSSSKTSDTKSSSTPPPPCKSTIAGRHTGSCVSMASTTCTERDISPKKKDPEFQKQPVLYRRLSRATEEMIESLGVEPYLTKSGVRVRYDNHISNSGLVFFSITHSLSARQNIEENQNQFTNYELYGSITVALPLEKLKKNSVNREVKMTGKLVKVHDAITSEYFYGRVSYEDKIALLAADDELKEKEFDKKCAELKKTFPDGFCVPRPKCFKGWLMVADEIEFIQYIGEKRSDCFVKYLSKWQRK
jgi:pyridoxine/pyridoxamine 5'-phosphate oxidase